MATTREPSCAVELALDVIGGRWAVVLLAHLKQGPRRYGELRRLVPGISEKMLTQRLQTLMASGLVSRADLGGNPPGSEYALTAAADGLGPALQALHDWGSERARHSGISFDEAGSPG